MKNTTLCWWSNGGAGLMGCVTKSIYRFKIVNREIIRYNARGICWCKRTTINSGTLRPSRAQIRVLHSQLTRLTPTYSLESKFWANWSNDFIQKRLRQMTACCVSRYNNRLKTKDQYSSFQKQWRILFINHPTIPCTFSEQTFLLLTNGYSVFILLLKLRTFRLGFQVHD